jgi:hypothetical protein
LKLYLHRYTSAAKLNDSFHSTEMLNLEVFGGSDGEIGPLLASLGIGIVSCDTITLASGEIFSRAPDLEERVSS